MPKRRLGDELNFVEAFHQIEPGARGEKEMDVETRMTLEPGADFGVLAGRVVVADDVQLELGSDCVTFGEKKTPPAPTSRNVQISAQLWNACGSRGAGESRRDNPAMALPGDRQPGCLDCDNCRYFGNYFRRALGRVCNAY